MLVKHSERRRPAAVKRSRQGRLRKIIVCKNTCIKERKKNMFQVNEWKNRRTGFN